MIVREYLDREYDLICKWWTAHNFDCAPEIALPSDGFIAEVENKPVGAIWLYTSDNSSIAWIEWLVCDPDAPPIHKVKAIRMLVDQAVIAAKAKGANIIFSSTKHKAVIKSFKVAGFVETDKDMTNLIYTSLETD